MIKNPLGKNHYEYLNELFQTKDKHTADSLKDIQDRNNLIKELEEKQKEFEARLNIANTEDKRRQIQANIEKIKRIVDMLKDETKKLKYDTALAVSPSVKLEVGGKEHKYTSIVPLVDIENIINEFNEFSNKKDEQGNLLFPEGNFKYERQEGPPVVHVFTFPDEKSMNDFLQVLFNKNMAMLPNGSQSLDNKPNPQNAIKEELGRLKSNSTQEPQENKEEKQLNSPLITKPSPFKTS
jgi:hypothetical protein